MKSYRLFFSWQSDRKEIKRVIQKSLRKVKINLKTQDIELVLDEDTRERTGKRKIDVEILKKIDDCDIFLADLTPVHTMPANDEKGVLPRHMPNSNVMYEYGYALHCKGENHMIVLANFATGEHVEFMPFDINHDTITPFSDENDLQNLEKWILNIIAIVDKERAEIVPEYNAGLFFIDISRTEIYTETTIHPKYKRIKYVKENREISELSWIENTDSVNLFKSLLTSQEYMKRLTSPIDKISTFKIVNKTTNYSLCPLDMTLINSGKQPLQNCKIKVVADDNRIVFSETNVKDSFSLNIYKTLNYVTHVSDKFIYQKIDILNLSERKIFDEFFVYVPCDLKSFNLHWSLSSMYHTQYGDIQVLVEPEYFDEYVADDSRFGKEEIVDYIIEE